MVKNLLGHLYFPAEKLQSTQSLGAMQKIAQFIHCPNTIIPGLVTHGQAGGMRICPGKEMTPLAHTTVVSSMPAQRTGR